MGVGDLVEVFYQELWENKTSDHEVVQEAVLALVEMVQTVFVETEPEECSEDELDECPDQDN